ncbi:MAG TPA: sulfatase [Bacteroidales bacterium]|nr:sulfatase [Bacteroidales bacterium]
MLNKLLITTLGVVPVVKGHSQLIQKSDDRPNIVILLIDDLGWKDVGFMGSKYFETPNIDKLSRQGMIFTNAYAACAVSSPTRASLQTGRYPSRVGVTDWIRARFQLNTTEVKAPEPWEENGNRKLRTPSNPYWMELSEVTIAEVLRKRGYFTCHIGKWHLGPDDYYPEEQGYDLNIAGNDMGQPVNYFDPYTNAKGVGFPNLKPRREGEYLVDRLASELKTVIEQHKDKPFFINMCTYAVHTPLMAKKEMISKYELKAVVDKQKNPVYAAMVESMDQTIGVLMHTLDENNLLDNTIIMFLSDNGGLIGPTDNSPLRSGKGYPYEGGIRIPMIVSWQGKINAGSTCDLPISTVDILPTVCALAKTPLPKNKIDGRDISPALREEKIREVPLYWHFPHYRGADVFPYSIIRDDDWKLIKRYEGTTFELYNLKNDLSEETDLANENPEMVKKLNLKLEKWLKATHAKMPLVKQ